MNASFRFWIQSTISAGLALISVSLPAQQNGRLKMNTTKAGVNWAKAREVATAASVSQEMEAAKPMSAQLAVMVKPLNNMRPGEGNSLYSKSLILYDGEMFTLIPVGSILHLPAQLRDRIIAKPQGEFTFWPNFLKRNATWLQGKEVDLKMAKGDRKLAAAVLKEVTKSNHLLVSVYRQCPITVLEPAPEQAPAKP